MKDDCPALARSITLDYIHDLFNNYTWIYTDGSNASQDAYLSYYAPSQAVRVVVTYPAVHSADAIKLLTMHLVLLWTSENIVTSSSFAIFSHCQYALQAVNQYQYVGKLEVINEILKSID